MWESTWEVVGEENKKVREGESSKRERVWERGGEGALGGGGVSRWLGCVVRKFPNISGRLGSHPQVAADTLLLLFPLLILATILKTHYPYIQ